MRGLITPGYAKENGLSDDQHQEAYIVLGTGVINLIVLTRAIKMGFWNKEAVLNLKRAIANRYALTQIAKSLQLEKYIFWGV
ncbi:MAG: ribonuclease III, partial [Candidatus Hodarchaeota archaeon]